MFERFISGVPQHTFQTASKYPSWPDYSKIPNQYWSENFPLPSRETLEQFKWQNQVNRKYFWVQIRTEETHFSDKCDKLFYLIIILHTYTRLLLPVNFTY